MTSITTVTVEGITYAAGGDPGGMMRAAWRVAAWNKAGGACAWCGHATRLDARPTDADRAECCHLLPGVGRGGYQAGNVANGCRSCNLWMHNRDMRDMVPMMAHPGAIVTERPTVGQSSANGAEWDIRAEARKARGLV